MSAPNRAIFICPSCGHVFQDKIVLTVGTITINRQEQTVAANGQSVHLTAKEFQILEFLALRKGIIATRSALLSYLYPFGDRPNTDVLNTFIAKLRRKLETANQGESYIETIRGRGHIMTDLIV